MKAPVYLSATNYFYSKPFSTTCSSRDASFGRQPNKEGPDTRSTTTPIHFDFLQEDTPTPRSGQHMPSREEHVGRSKVEGLVQVK